MAERRDKIELFYLPSYYQTKSLWRSPELNPEERLNDDLKHAMGTKVPARTKDPEHMTKLEQSPAHVMSFFQYPRVKYAI